MPLAIYGHFGQPILAFPTAAADFEEFERQGMVRALTPFIEAGLIKLVTIDSINGESWSARNVPIPEAARRQEAYVRFVGEEVTAAIYRECQGTVPIATLGASFGAFHAMNTLFRYPQKFRAAYGLSGIYDISEMFGSHFDHNCYLNSPKHYLPNLRGGDQWEAIVTSRITVLCGQGPWERVHWTTWFDRFLTEQGVPHRLDLWGHDVAHDWPWWFKQMDHYLRMDVGTP